MGFIGAIPQPVRQVLGQYVRDLELTPLLIGAGNFTIGSVVRSCGYRGPIVACDVSLYTSALGAFLSGCAFDVEEKADCPEHLKGLLETGSILDTVASISLLYELHEVWQVKNPYQKQMVARYKEQWPELMTKTREKLVRYKEHMGEVVYMAEDGFSVLERYDRASHAVFTFPPTYKRGYERLEKLLRAVIKWEPPSYREMTDTNTEIYRLVAEYGAYFVVLQKELKEVFEIIGPPSAVIHRGRGKYSYLVTKETPKKIVVRKTIDTQTAGPIWPATRPITGTEKVSIRILKQKQTLRLNELFLSSGIDYFDKTGGGVSLGVCLNGEIIGKGDLAESTHPWKIVPERPIAYLLSDLAVPSETKKLAKLVLLALLSSKAKRVLDLHYIMNFYWVGTTAFSKHPASMKYRGIFKLHKRKEAEGGYMLNYYAQLGKIELSDVVKVWKQKYG